MDGIYTWERNGFVNGLKEAYQQKYLRMEKGQDHSIKKHVCGQMGNRIKNGMKTIALSGLE